MWLTVLTVLFTSLPVNVLRLSTSVKEYRLLLPPIFSEYATPMTLISTTMALPPFYSPEITRPSLSDPITALLLNFKNT